MFDVFLNPDAWIALLTLTFLEIVLGIDNIIFISIAAGKLEEKDRVKATNIGLILAMLLRVGLLFGISLLTALNQPFLDTRAPKKFTKKWKTKNMKLKQSHLVNLSL
jgi:predicted tellurium resistance membrane protein TerC